MAFKPKTWKNGEDGGTPITAAELNRIEQGVSTIETTPGPQGKTGPKGEPGTPGAKGDTGSPGTKGDTGADGPKGTTGTTGPAGTDGSDGFPTEEQWDLLVARVETLEP